LQETRIKPNVKLSHNTYGRNISKAVQSSTPRWPCPVIRPKWSFIYYQLRWILLRKHAHRAIYWSK